MEKFVRVIRSVNGLPVVLFQPPTPQNQDIEQCVVGNTIYTLDGVMLYDNSAYFLYKLLDEIMDTIIPGPLEGPYLGQELTMVSEEIAIPCTIKAPCLSKCFIKYVFVCVLASLMSG